MFNIGSVLASSWASFNEPNPNENDYANPNLKHAIGCPGEQAVVDEVINAPGQAGRVYFRDSWWPAQCVHEITIQPGDIVRVIGIEGITLIVEPLGLCQAEAAPTEIIVETVIETVIETLTDTPIDITAYSIGQEVIST